jgi:hypothetical protein
MKWERCEKPNRPHNHQRDDGWSIYLVDDELLIWKLCGPDGKEEASLSDLPPDEIDRVLKLADQMIASF